MLEIRGRLSVPDTPEGHALLEKITEQLAPHLNGLSIGHATEKHGHPFNLVYLSLVEREHAKTNPQKEQKEQHTAKPLT